MNRNNIISVLLVVFLLFFGACGDDDNLVGSDDISPEDVELMMEAFRNAGIMGGPFMPMAGMMSQNKGAKSVTALSDENAQDFDQNISCPEGGSANYQGSVNHGENQLSTQLSVDLQSCSSRDGDDNMWTFNGHLDYNLNLTGDEESFEMNGTHEGIIDFESNVATDSCNMDVSYSFSGSQTGVSGQVTGSVCGQDVTYGI